MPVQLTPFNLPRKQFQPHQAPGSETADRSTASIIQSIREGANIPTKTGTVARALAKAQEVYAEKAAQLQESWEKERDVAIKAREDYDKRFNDMWTKVLSSARSGGGSGGGGGGGGGGPAENFRKTLDKKRADLQKQDQMMKSMTTEKIEDKLGMEPGQILKIGTHTEQQRMSSPGAREMASTYTGVGMRQKAGTLYGDPTQKGRAYNLSAINNFEDLTKSYTYNGQTVNPPLRIWRIRRYDPKLDQDPYTGNPRQSTEKGGAARGFNRTTIHVDYGVRDLSKIKETALNQKGLEVLTGLDAKGNVIKGLERKDPGKIRGDSRYFFTDVPEVYIGTGDINDPKNWAKVGTKGAWQWKSGTARQAQQDLEERDAISKYAAGGFPQMGGGYSSYSSSQGRDRLAGEFQEDIVQKWLADNGPRPPAFNKPAPITRWQAMFHPGDENWKRGPARRAADAVQDVAKGAVLLPFGAAAWGGQKAWEGLKRTPDALRWAGDTARSMLPGREESLPGFPARGGVNAQDKKEHLLRIARDTGGQGARTLPGIESVIGMKVKEVRDLKMLGNGWIQIKGRGGRWHDFELSRMPEEFFNGLNKKIFKGLKGVPLPSFKVDNSPKAVQQNFFTPLQRMP